MTKKLQTFTVMAKCYRDITVEISAENLDNALLRAKELKDEDFVTLHGDYIDGSTEIYGVFKS